MWGSLLLQAFAFACATNGHLDPEPHMRCRFADLQKQCSQLLTAEANTDSATDDILKQVLLPCRRVMLSRADLWPICCHGSLCLLMCLTAALE